MVRPLCLLAMLLALASCARAPVAAPHRPAGCADGLPGSEAGAPSDLPADRAVGRGVLVYRPCADCGAWLVTEDGARYGVPPVPWPPPVTYPAPGTSPLGAPLPETPRDPMFGLRLSPDGRWLLRPGVGTTLVRDLAGTTERHVAHVDIGAWSDDGRWVVSGDGQDGDAALVDLTTGERRPVRRDEEYRWWRIAAVLGRDQVLLARAYNREDSDPDPRRETYVVIDPATGAVRRELSVDFGQTQVSTEGSVIGGGSLVIQAITAPADPGEVIVVDLATGRVRARHRLPAEQPAGYGFWHVAGLAGGEVVLVRSYSFGSPVPKSDPIQVFAMDVSTGRRRLTCTLPPRSELMLPG
jgi:hypothetical protein